MDTLSPNVRILLSLCTEPLRFTDLVKESGLSKPTVSKWVKVLEAVGLITSKEGTYGLTESGVSYLRGVLTPIVRDAFDQGLVEDVTLYVTNDFIVDKMGDEYALIVHHVGELGQTSVTINVGDDTETIIENLKRVIKSLERITKKKPEKEVSTR